MANIAQELPSDLHVPAGVSLHASIMRSCGARLPDVATFFGSSALNENHAILKGRWAQMVQGLAPLQRMVNHMASDAGVIATDGPELVDSHIVTNVGVGRAIMLRAIADRSYGVMDVLADVDELQALLPDDGVREETMDVYMDELPLGRRVELNDHDTAWSVLMALCGVTGTELKAFGVHKGDAGRMANGQLPIDDCAIASEIAGRVIAVAGEIRFARDVEEIATDEEALLIGYMAPYELATAWQLFPTARTELERWSPYIMTSERADGWVG